MNYPPPPDLADREPLIFEVPAGQVWYRSHRVAYDAIYFGKGSQYRWDAPRGEYGVLYLAADPYGAFMESIGRGALKSRLVFRADLENRGLSLVQSIRPLRLIDLVNSGGLTRLGAESSLTSGSGYKNSRRWSKALKKHPATADGIYYRSRHDPSRFACALYQECESVLKAEASERWSGLPTLLGEILDHYAFGTDL